jgi:pyruvate kinase
MEEDQVGSRRRTKIVATIGPASESPSTLTALIDAGMDMARLGLAHGPVEESIAKLERIRAAAAERGRYVGVLADLPGPKVRAGAFPVDGVTLSDGSQVQLVAGEGKGSDASTISVEYPSLLEELEPGDLVALGDGGVTLRIEKIGSTAATARVESGGLLLGRPGVNLPPEKFSVPTPTAQDLVLLEAVAEAGIDAVAISFVRTAQDVETVRKAVGPDGPMLVAKIETPSAVDDLEAIVQAADGVMVARGDLGVRLPLEDVPHIQKRIIRTGVSWGRPVITATQMLESMVHAPTPTRAEVSDVANAVLDGSSALMLSAETAVGHDPVAAVTAMSRIAERAEREFDFYSWGRGLGRQMTGVSAPSPSPQRIVSAITAAAWQAAVDADATAIICATRTGQTAKSISRFRPTAPLLAVTPSERTARQLSVAWGVRPVVDEERSNIDDIVWFAVKAAVDAGTCRSGDVVVVLAGFPDEPEPATDVLRLVRVH